MALTVGEQATAIAEGTDTFVLINNRLRNDFRNVLLLAALAFEDDGSLVLDGDVAEVEQIDADQWPYVATQLEIGLAHSGLAPSVRSRWELAIKGVARIAGQDFPCRRGELDYFVPF